MPFCTANVAYPERTSAVFFPTSFGGKLASGQFGVVNFEQTRMPVGLTLINTPPTLRGLFLPRVFAVANNQ